MLQLYVAQEICGWLDASGERHWDEGGDFDSRIERCVEAAAKAWPRQGVRRTPVQVWVSGELARPFLCGPVTGLKGADEIRSFAQSRVADATGWNQACEVHLEGDVRKGVVLAIAMPVAVLAQIESLIGRAKLRLVSLRPWWAAVLDQALATQPGLELLVVEEPESLTLLAGKAGIWSMAEVFSPKPSADEAARTVRRLAAGAFARPESSAWLRLDSTGAEVSRALWPSAQTSPLEGQS